MAKIFKKTAKKSKKGQIKFKNNGENIIGT